MHRVLADRAASRYAFRMENAYREWAGGSSDGTYTSKSALEESDALSAEVTWHRRMANLIEGMLK